MTHLLLKPLLLLAVLAFGCQTSDEQPTPGTPPTPPAPITYLALGDSYTIGESVKEGGRYPVQLAASLRQNGTDIADPTIVARTGWTTFELEAGIGAADIQGKEYGLVSLLIGVNDQFRGRPVADYRPDFTGLLHQAIAFAGGDTSRVFVVSIPDYAFTPFGNGSTAISAGIDEYNAANREITEAFGIRYFDITPISREGLDEPELVASDGLHPSAEQYRRWVELMVEEVEMMVKK